MDSIVGQANKSLEEHSLHLLIFEEAHVRIELSSLLHGHELLESDATSDSLVHLLLQHEVLAQVSSVSRALSSSCAISHSQVPDLVNLGLLQVKWVEARWHISARGHDVAEIDIWVGELGAQKTVHVGVVAGDLQVAPQHLD